MIFKIKPRKHRQTNRKVVRSCCGRVSVWGYHLLTHSPVALTLNLPWNTTSLRKCVCLVGPGSAAPGSSAAFSAIFPSLWATAIKQDSLPGLQALMCLLPWICLLNLPVTWEELRKPRANIRRHLDFNSLYVPKLAGTLSSFSPNMAKFNINIHSWTKKTGQAKN